MKRIHEASMRCDDCGWQGVVDDCEPDIDGDGNLGCPACGSVVRMETPNDILEEILEARGPVTALCAETALWPRGRFTRDMAIDAGHPEWEGMPL